MGRALVRSRRPTRVLSAPAYRVRCSAELEFDHPRVPFPANGAACGRMAGLGRKLGSAHLLEAAPPPEVADTLDIELTG